MNAASSSGVRHARAPRVLVVDDEADLRELLELTLVGMGFDVDCAADLGQARDLLSRHAYALCLTDMRLPDGLGLELVEEIGRLDPPLPVAVITAYGSAENAVAALKAGAFDYLSKPVALDALRNLVRAAIAAPVASAAGAGTPESSSGSASIPALDELLGGSAAMRDVRASILRLAHSMAPVAISGESGSGKELAARLLHQAGGRAERPFIAVNCGAIPESLMEAEFFGYRKGAFTGADEDRDGFFQAASGGTLFLDEVADLPLPMQVKLLRAIQEKRVRRVGATGEEPVDVRLISATHQDLAQCVASGKFRQDLFYRLNVIALRMPPLRERPEDIPALARTVLARIAARAGVAAPPELSGQALEALCAHPFPGNVRELENILERALAFSDGRTIDLPDLGIDAAASGAGGAEPLPGSLPDYLDQIEREAITKALEKTGFNRTAAAKLLGISFRALRYRMQRLGIG